MKKVLLAGVMLLLIIGMANISFAVPGTITLDSNANGGGDYFNGISFFFEAGTYEFSVADGGWNAWFYPSGKGTQACDSDGANCQYGWMWTADIYQESTSSYFRLGSKTVKYDSQEKAYNAHASDFLVLDNPSDGNLWFYVKDGQPGDSDSLAHDNAGLVTFNVARVSGPNPIPVVPEPVSSILFIAGAATLGFRRFRNKTK
ncbi:MAG: PEP-CTERM sorting domain-containing protein [Nitrospirota bacterium]